MFHFRRRDNRVLRLVVLLLLVMLVLGLIVHGFVTETKLATERNYCASRVHGIVAAMHAYEECHGSFPPAFLVDDKGVPTHSWRVLLLPQFGERGLYAQYRFDEPWNSDNNLMLARRIAELYQCGGDSGRIGPEMTDFVVIVGKDTMFPGKQTRSMEDASDAAQKILVVEIARSDIHCLEPRDLDFENMSLSVNDRNHASISTSRRGGPAVGLTRGKRLRFELLDPSTAPEALRDRIVLSKSVGEKSGTGENAK